MRDEALEFLIKARWVEGAARSHHIEDTKTKSSELLSLVLYAQLRGLPAVPFGWEDELKRYVVSPLASSTDRLWLMNLSLLHTELGQRALEQAERMTARTRVVRYYNENRRRFFVPEHRDLAIVEASSFAAMRNARRALIAGVPPRVVAKRFSEGPYDAGGLKRHYAKGRGAVALDSAIFSAPLHNVVGPLRVYWFYVFEALKIEPRRRQRLAEVEARIRRTLAEHARAGRLDVSLAKSWRSQTVCRAGYRVAGCGAVNDDVSRDGG